MEPVSSANARPPMHRIVTVAAHELLELIFPSRCLGCDRRGTWFCPECADHSRLNRRLRHCQLCNRVVDKAGQLCRRHRDDLHLTGLISFGNYHTERCKRTIRRIKIGGLTSALPTLVDAAWSAWEPLITAQTWQAVLAVPSGAHRDRVRGFNVARLVAAELGRRLELVPSPHFGRTRQTRAQVELTRAERLTNLIGAFAWRGPRLSGSVLLVDDVVTTGATLLEAARSLRSAGASEVWAVTLAHEV